MKTSRFFTALLATALIGWATVHPTFAANKSKILLPTEQELTADLADVQKMADGDVKTALINELQTSLDLLQLIQTQQKNNEDLHDVLAHADSEIKKNNADLLAFKKQLEQSKSVDYQAQNLADLQAALSKLSAQQQETQTALSKANTQLAGQSSVSERAQTSLTENLKRTQEINQQLADSNLTKTLRQKNQIELQLIDLKNAYNQDLLKNSDQLTLLYQSRYDLLNVRLQLLQQQIVAIQEVINQKNLAQTQNQVEQVQQQQNSAKNAYIQKELERNADLSQYLLQQTEKTNILTQDDLRMRNVFDSLTQTQHTIEEQISALQGTLVLSRIIQQQKQKLPTNLNIQGLSKQIADLRVQIFDITQKRNELYDLDAYIAKVESDEGEKFTNTEKIQLTNLLTERRKMSSDLIKSLNNQLNLAISLELTQQQITQISDQIQLKLDQQSFWVKSNSPINLDWFAELPRAFIAQVDGILKKIGLPTNYSNLPYLLMYCLGLFVVGGAIFKFKDRIKQRLSKINGEINRLKYDNQWNTPQALLFTAFLTLSGTLWFLAICQMLGFFLMKNPTEFWDWSFSMAGYWWFFTFWLSLFRPNGIFVRHFEFSQQSAVRFQSVIKRIVVAVILLLNTSVFSNVTDYGLANDVIGQVNTIVSLLFCIIIIAPRFKNVLRSYEDEKKNHNHIIVKIVQFGLQIIPVGLVLLVALGYYYTALNLIQHLINSYIAWCVWWLIRQVIYRGITVSSRRLAHRRLEEKLRQKQAGFNDGSTSDDVVVLNEKEEGLALNEVRSQLLRFADLFIWTALIGIFYYVWSDLVTVASYLREVTLWQQTTTTEAGTVRENQYF